MTADAVLVAETALAVSLVASGIALLAAGRARVSALLLVLAGALGVAGMLLDSRAHDTAATSAYLVGATLCVAPAILAYPRFSWRPPADFVALTTVVAAGVLATIQGGNDTVVAAMCTVIVVVLVTHTWWRIEHAAGADRRALVWVALTAGVASVATFTAPFLLSDTGGAVTVIVVWALIGPAMVVGVKWPDVVDVRGVVVEVTVLAVSLIAYVALVRAVVSLLELVGGASPDVGTVVVVGAIAAIAYNPFRRMLRGVTDELLFGERPDPLDAASHVVGQIGDDPALALRAICDVLVLPYASLIVDGVPVATSGALVTHTRHVPAAIGQDMVGELIVGMRPGDLNLGRNDELVLRLVAPLLAQTLRSKALAEDLRASRWRTVAAIEEERRRLRRDLHDGLGPRLSGIAFMADAARNSLRGDPVAAEEMLRSVRAETATAISEIRELVYAMRPPALDELGLVGALEATARSFGLFRVAGPHELPRLPAAVEVAAYRIAVEAMTNTVRHANAVHGTVTVEVGESLRVDITDDGVGIPVSYRSGVGVASMRERAEELGGSFVVRALVPSGTLVRATIPLPAPVRGDRSSSRVCA